MTVAVLQSDGGARGNPGPAGAGFVLLDASGEVITSGGRYLGEATNNVAEYEALLWGLEVAAATGITDLTVQCDSELVVKQLNGQYRVKHPGLKPLYVKASGLLKRFPAVRVVHIRREHNSIADGLANDAMDCRGMVGDAPLPRDAGSQDSLF
ncbi:MAG: ribonuclease HI family protein [Actinomycetota bacterium]|nr:ribonuclease HI family protein [Actinomycetota bacterium]MDZ4180142.1 ribonuclease HI family protein [Coriobacteriia bacterium]